MQNPGYRHPHIPRNDPKSGQEASQQRKPDHPPPGEHFRPLRPSARTRMEINTDAKRDDKNEHISKKPLWINSSTPHSEWSKTRTRKKIWCKNNYHPATEDSWQSTKHGRKTIQPRPATEQRIYQRHKSSHSIESTGSVPGLNNNPRRVYTPSGLNIGSSGKLLPEINISIRLKPPGGARVKYSPPEGLHPSG